MTIWSLHFFGRMEHFFLDFINCESCGSSIVERIDRKLILKVGVVVGIVVGVGIEYSCKISSVKYSKA